MYYVYEWYIVATGEIIYVGKGTHNRYKVRKHNRFFNDMIRRFKCDSRIVKEFDTEKEAFEYEFERVRDLKAKGQCACNIYDGGTGGSTEWWTPELKERYSEKNVMKSQRQRERMSDRNPMKQTDIAKKANASKRRAVIIGETEYESVTAVCEKYGVYNSTVAAWCVNGVTKFGEPCRYKDGDLSSPSDHRNDGQNRPLTYKGKRYNSSADLARAIGVSQTTAARWCRNGRDPHGNECKYDDDNRDVIDSTNPSKISVIINGVWYPSKEQARKAIGVTAYTLTQLLEGKKKDDRYICEYGNQQPSRGNTDNSTSEGSTTNR